MSKTTTTGEIVTEEAKPPRPAILGVLRGDVAGLDPCCSDPGHTTTTHPVQVVLFDMEHGGVRATYTCGHWTAVTA